MTIGLAMALKASPNSNHARFNGVNQSGRRSATAKKAVERTSSGHLGEPAWWNKGQTPNIAKMIPKVTPNVRLDPMGVLRKLETVSCVCIILL
ncbi:MULTISPECIES: hypothetical protein [Methylosinus]|uniref:hypothetical protein n=1 Tax=Methylosinus TaxID=425 RepID=UPI0012DBE54F|nr:MULTISPECIES: hypothetical protein [Methylosinus]